MVATRGEAARVPLTLFTDALVIRGFARSSATRVTDILNQVAEAFLVLEDVTVEEFGERGQPIRAAYAQTNLEAVLFAVIEEKSEPTPGLHVAKQPEQAIVSVPPFRITGTIHLVPAGDLHQGLSSLTGRFIPVTEATFWSERVGEARQSAEVLAVNRHRAQILAPHIEMDPWAGLHGSSQPETPAGA